MQVAPRGPGDKGRIATVELRAATVRIKRPRVGASRALAETIELGLVEAREVDAPKANTPLLWRLLTTLPVATAAHAQQVVQLYRLRWRIEQVFRALKSDGLKLDDSQMVDAERLFNLAAIGMAAAIRTIQLVDARDGSPRPATDVVDQTFAVPLQLLSKKLEGKTARQKNPHPPGSLAFVAWITARLGGWNCYYKPPGPKTMRQGWNQLAAKLKAMLLLPNTKIRKSRSSLRENATRDSQQARSGEGLRRDPSPIFVVEPPHSPLPQGEGILSARCDFRKTPACEISTPARGDFNKPEILLSMCSKRMTQNPSHLELFERLYLSRTQI